MRLVICDNKGRVIINLIISPSIIPALSKDVRIIALL